MMFMMMSKMMMIVLMIPTIDKTDQQHQQHVTTPTTHRIGEPKHYYIALHWFQFTVEFILFISSLFTIERSERGGELL